MGAKHTPGPWISVEDQGERFVGYTDTRPREWDGKTGCFAPIAYMAGNQTDEADAALIAAAPDLLAAVKRLYAWAYDFGQSGDGGFWDFSESDEGKEALAALAKAEPRS